MCASTLRLASSYGVLLLMALASVSVADQTAAVCPIPGGFTEFKLKTSFYQGPDIFSSEHYSFSTQAQLSGDVLEALKASSSLLFRQESLPIADNIDIEHRADSVWQNLTFSKAGTAISCTYFGADSQPPASYSVKIHSKDQEDQASSKEVQLGERAKSYIDSVWSTLGEIRSKKSHSIVFPYGIPSRVRVSWTGKQLSMETTANYVPGGGLQTGCNTQRFFEAFVRWLLLSAATSEGEINDFCPF